MRNFIDALTPKAKLSEDVKTKDKTGTTLDVETPTSKGQVSTTRARSDVTTGEIPGKKAGREKTRSSVRAPADPRAADYMGRLAASGLEDEIDDEEAARRAGHTDGAEPTTVTPQTLPAVVNNALAETGANITPEWHMVKHLSGYMQQAIRAMGRMIFAPFTNTPIEEIQVLSTLSNDEIEVKAMMTWIMRNGIRDDKAELQFNEILPAYSAQTQIWNAEGATFMVVKDFAGIYVYAWPGGRGVHVGGSEAPRQIEA